MDLLVPAIALLPVLLGEGDGTFRLPLHLPLPTGFSPQWAAAGDVNADGRLDLAVAGFQAGGGTVIPVLLQDAAHRDRWEARPLSIAGRTASLFFILAADFTGDGSADLVACDPATSAWFLRAKGDGGFEDPVVLPRSEGSRAVAAADLDGDGRLDLASASWREGEVSVHLGKGDGTFEHAGAWFVEGEPHELEALDFDGDARPDLAPKLSHVGIHPLRNRGGGSFQVLPRVVEVGIDWEIAAGDFDRDGKGDLAGSRGVGISRGDGTFRRTLELDDVLASAAADLDGDAILDLAVPAKVEGLLAVHPGLGDGRFAPPVLAGPTGVRVTFLSAWDLDRDGRPDLVASDREGSFLVIHWGAGGEGLLDGGKVRPWPVAPASIATGDLDGSGADDIFIRTGAAEVMVDLDPGAGGPPREPVRIPTAVPYQLLEAVDLDGDGIPDLIGASSTRAEAWIALLDASGRVRREASFPSGPQPAAIRAARLDAGESMDLAIVSTSANKVAVVLDAAGAAPRVADVPTIERPLSLAVGDLDGDGIADLAVHHRTTLAVQFGTGDGGFGAPVLLSTPLPLFLETAIADVDGDRRADLAASSFSALQVFAGKGSRDFDAPRTVALAARPSSMEIADLDGDGLPEVTLANSVARSVSILANGPAGLSPPGVHGLTLPLLGHRLGDHDGDGALDLALWGAWGGVVVPGRPSASGEERFRRGDADGNGASEVTDAIVVLAMLFTGGAALPCADAADANDDGALDLSDPIATLGHLFLGQGPLPPPTACGGDPTDDALDCAGGPCR